MTNQTLIQEVLITPDKASKWSHEQWSLMIQQGYATNLLARIYEKFSDSSLTSLIPSEFKWHLSSAHTKFLAHQHDVKIEISKIKSALSMANIDPVFLKGAAYIAAGDKAQSGRLFSDIDILIPKDKISAAEEVLSWNGWATKDVDDHDNKYYRQWMHEIPPMTHQSRGSTLDVHHNLTSIIGRVSINATLLLDNAVKNQQDGTKVLSPEDRVLHSATHLLLASEFNHGFRDLSDLDILLRQFSGKDKDFWNKILDRAQELELTFILFYTFKYTALYFKTPIPDNIINTLSQAAPSKQIQALMNFCLQRVLRPKHESCQQSYTSLAELLLFLRSHWLLMPVHILIPHLFHKTFISPINIWIKSREAEATSHQ